MAGLYAAVAELALCDVHSCLLERSHYQDSQIKGPEDYYQLVYYVLCKKRCGVHRLRVTIPQAGRSA